MEGLEESIYLKAIGEIDPEKDDVPAELGVEDAFEDGSDCDKAYEIVYNLKTEIVDELYNRYQTTKSQADLEKWHRYEGYLDKITSQMTKIQDILGERMYLYGKRAYALGYDTDLGQEP
ncbi:MAG: hypothetical protein LUE65_00460 [Clostridiales bacterium]|nr:hypothetical protein [Clostridiales bacterium]